MKVRFYSAGYCTGPGFIANRNLPKTVMKFPAPFVLIEHPVQGLILFDTGYHPRFYKATETFPEILYAKLTPCFVDDEQSAMAQLNSEKIAPQQIDHLIVSHFHADHVAGAADFPQAQLHCHLSGWQFMMRANRLNRVRKGYLRTLLPDTFADGANFVNQFPLSVSTVLGHASTVDDLHAVDLFGDQTIYLVDLPGHAAGQVGMLLRLSTSWLMLLADACWLADNLLPDNDPHWIASPLYDSIGKFNHTLGCLRALYQRCADDVLFVPSHCAVTIDKLCRQGVMS